MRDCAGEQAPPSRCRSSARSPDWRTRPGASSPRAAPASDGPGVRGPAVPDAAPARARGPRPRPLELPGPVDAPATADAVEPDADGNCPSTHPIKGKLSTGIYHRPGAFAYDRTAPTVAIATTAARVRRSARRQALSASVLSFVDARTYCPATTTKEDAHALERLQEVHHEGQRVCDLAVAVIIGIAFGLLVNSFVKDIIMPIIGAVVGKPSFNDLTLEHR